MTVTAFQRMRRNLSTKKVIDEKLDIEKDLSEMEVNDLIAYAQKRNIDIGKATSKSGILEKIKIAQAE